MALPWIQGVMCFLYDNQQRVRLCDYRNTNHKIHAGKYSPNGGKFENGESSEQATIREILEETNTIVKKLRYRGRVHFNNERRTVKGKPMKFNMSVDMWDCYVPNFDDREARAKEPGALLEWINKSEILSKELHEGDKKVWEWLQKYSCFEGTIVQDGERLVEEESKIISYNPNPLHAN